jgi:hypothetical protein
MAQLYTKSIGSAVASALAKVRAQLINFGKPGRHNPQWSRRGGNAGSTRRRWRAGERTRYHAQKTGPAEIAAIQTTSVDQTVDRVH